MTGNVITKRYMSDNEKFADVFNYILYNGEKVIKPEQLCGCDPNELLVERGNKDSLIVTDKVRDIKKNWILKRDEDYSYLLMGVENQTDVHYAMPLRVMLYDALEYDSQYKAIMKEHRKNKDLDEKEFISGFSKEDKIVPVITVVVYYGADEWDGPRSLHDMLGDVDEKLLNSINDYKLNLIEPAAIEDMDKFSSDFKYVIQVIKNSNDKRKLNKIISDNRDYFSKVPTETAMLIKQCTDIDVYITEEKEDINMCKAIEDMKADAREEGRQEVRKEMSKAIEDMKADAREEGRQEVRKEMCKAIEDMKADAREEGRQEVRKEMCKAIEDMKADAREEGRQEVRKEMCKAIEDMKADAREEGRQEGETIAIIKLYLKGLIDEDKSAEELGMSVEQYRECVKLYDNV